MDFICHLTVFVSYFVPVLPNSDFLVMILDIPTFCFKWFYVYTVLMYLYITKCISFKNIEKLMSVKNSTVVLWAVTEVFTNVLPSCWGLKTAPRSQYTCFIFDENSFHSGWEWNQ
jgi:hypothetical protein